MVSQRSNRAANAISEDRILDAAYELLLSRGLRRMTMADVARAAGISRATLYRRWPNVEALAADVTTREFAKLLPDLDGSDRVTRTLLVASVTQAVQRLRRHPLVRKIVQTDPEFLLPYLLQRRGRSTKAQLAVLEAALRHADRSVGKGNPAAQASTIWLVAASFVLTAPVFADRKVSLRSLDTELHRVLDRYLAP